MPFDFSADDARALTGYLLRAWRVRVQRLELAYATKDSANEHFRDGQPEEARARYWKAGMLMDVIGNKGTEIEMPADRTEVRCGSRLRLSRLPRLLASPLPCSETALGVASR